MEQQEFVNEVPERKNYSMKWYKTLLVLLWLGMAGNLLVAISYFTGTQYKEFTDQVYELLPSLKAMDIFAGIYAIGMVAWGFITWLNLKKYKKHAPKLLIVMYLANMLFYIVYMIAFYAIISGAETKIIYGDAYIEGGNIYQKYLDLNKVTFSATEIVPVVVSAVMVVVNYIYFKKRSELFVY